MDIESIFYKGMSLTIKATRDDAVADFDTTIVEIVGDCLLCEPITYEGKAVSFKSPGLKTELNIFDKSAGKMYCWKNPDIKLGYYKKKTLCQLIYLTSEPIVVNRRNNYRQYVGLPGKVVYFRSAPVEVLIRDVSNNGIGFIMEKKAEFKVGKTISVSFNDEEGRYRFDLVCQVVRERECDNGRFEYGCLVPDAPYTLGAYVAHKQVEERKRVLGHI